jgi:hypothetical protein
MNMERLGEWKLVEEIEVLGGSCPGAILSPTNSTWPDLELNSGRSGGKPEANIIKH